MRAYPAPYGINAAHVLGYLSPITEDELDEAKSPATTRPCTAPRSSAGPGWRRSTTSTCAGVPGYKRVAVDSMGRVLGDSGEVEGRAGDTLVTSIDARCSRSWSSSSRRPSRPRARPSTRSPASNYVADSGAVVVLDAKNGRVVAMAGAPTYDPKVWVGGITSKQLEPALLGQGATTRCSSGPPRASSRPGSTWKPIMTAGALDQRLQPEHPAGLLVGLPGRQPVVQELRVGVLRR